MQRQFPIAVYCMALCICLLLIGENQKRSAQHLRTAGTTNLFVKPKTVEFKTIRMLKYEPENYKLDSADESFLIFDPEI